MSPVQSAAPKVVRTIDADVWRVSRWGIDHTRPLNVIPPPADAPEGTLPTTTGGDLLEVRFQAGLRDSEGYPHWHEEQTRSYEGATLAAIIANAAAKAKASLAASTSPHALAIAMHDAIKTALYEQLQADGCIPAGDGITVA